MLRNVGWAYVSNNKIQKGQTIVCPFLLYNILCTIEEYIYGFRQS